jgi:hypothetical protein
MEDAHIMLDNVSDSNASGAISIYGGIYKSLLTFLHIVCSV